jgi:hypothetical protein
MSLKRRCCSVDRAHGAIVVSFSRERTGASSVGNDAKKPAKRQGPQRLSIAFFAKRLPRRHSSTSDLLP